MDVYGCEGGKWLAVVCVCVCESLVCLHQLSRVLDVRPTRGFWSSLSLSLSLPLFPGNVILSAHICLSAVEWGLLGWVEET